MTGIVLLGLDVSTVAGKVMAASGGLTLILAGRWLLRAQAIASLLRTGGFFVILLGVLSLVGVVDVDTGTLVGLAGDVARVLLDELL